MIKNVLVGCEESQAVANAFRELGHNAFSCDIQPCSGGHPEYPMMCDVREAVVSRFWDIIIFHPDCTYMAVSGNRWYGCGTEGVEKRRDAVQWTIDTWKLICMHSEASCLENPVSVIFMLPELRYPQYIQPWMFGHGETKKTGLYLRNLPELVPTDVVSGREQKVWKMPPSADRKKLRSKTYPGIAKVMAAQWGGKA
jgi:hypothetical protein